MLGASNKTTDLLNSFPPAPKEAIAAEKRSVSVQEMRLTLSRTQGGGVIQDFHFSDAPCGFGVALSVLKS